MMLWRNKFSFLAFASGNALVWHYGVAPFFTWLGLPLILLLFLAGAGGRALDLFVGEG